LRPCFSTCLPLIHLEYNKKIITNKVLLMNGRILGLSGKFKKISPMTGKMFG